MSIFANSEDQDEMLQTNLDPYCLHMGSIVREKQLSSVQPGKT